jgi:hypothetical protein
VTAADDRADLRYMILAGLAITVMIGFLVRQVLVLLSRGGLDAITVIRLAFGLFVLAIMVYLAYTAFSLWT